jgi:nickel transport protein
MTKKIIFCALFSTASLWAHDLQVRVQQAPPAVVAHTTYAGSEPVAYAAVLVYSPLQQETEYQNGRTDANGVFSFVPDREGEWRFVVDDGMGHHAETPITVSADAAGGVHSAAQEPMSMGFKLITGLAIIVGVTGFLYGLKSRPH